MSPLFKAGVAGLLICGVILWIIFELLSMIVSYIEVIG